ncbi:MAG: DUF2130 domain-containing protein [Bacteroidetes bacterium]|nr:DUF2130 domain-containing protein [Bacteroidota bacterium]
MREREKIIDDLKQQVETIKRKAEQGSMQMQGEVQELELENILRETYIYDDINEIKKDNAVQIYFKPCARGRV